MQQLEKLLILDVDEYYFLRDSGLYVKQLSKDTVSIHNKHYSFAKAILNNRRNPINIRKKKNRA